MVFFSLKYCVKFYCFFNCHFVLNIWLVANHLNCKLETSYSHMNFKSNLYNLSNVCNWFKLSSQIIRSRLYKNIIKIRLTGILLYVLGPLGVNLHISTYISNALKHWVIWNISNASKLWMICTIKYTGFTAYQTCKSLQNRMLGQWL